MDYQDGIDRFYVPGSGIGPGGVGLGAIDTPIGHGTFVTYSGGSFFILGFDGSFAPTILNDRISQVVAIDAVEAGRIEKG
jgi:hypothetical protein